jgi:glycogen debranching enzyme
VQASGDVAYLRTHRKVVEKAWAFETSHDSDNDGIYDNSQGTGWVESWPGGQPHQEIYLALLDQQASTAMAKLAAFLGDQATAGTAAARAAKVGSTIESEYFVPRTGEYAFSRNADGSLDKTATIYPALAWWSAGGTGLAHADKSLRRWDSHDFSTDWGLRDVAETESFFDSMSYHQGSVWPLFTGWASLADYRTGRNLSGYAHLMQNADQTTTQDLGAVTELLSGAFFVPFGRSTSHQLWSSAMVITPAMRGLFGITVDAAAGKVDVQPQLPAEWGEAAVRRVHVGESVCSRWGLGMDCRIRVRGRGRRRCWRRSTRGGPCGWSWRVRGEVRYGWPFGVTVARALWRLREGL